MGFLSSLRPSFQLNSVHSSTEAHCFGDDDNDKAAVRPLLLAEEALPRLIEKGAGHKLTPEAPQSEHAPLLSRSYASYSYHQQPPPQTNIGDFDVTDTELKNIELLVDTWNQFSTMLFFFSILAISLIIKPMPDVLKGSVKHCADALLLSAVPGWFVSVYLLRFYSRPDQQMVLARSIRSSRFISFITLIPSITMLLSWTGLAFEVLVGFFPAAINYIIVLFIVFCVSGYVAVKKLRALLAREARDDELV
ncbi:hypothetical protein PENSPDRAFT_748099 [Peniophora sp. CONT]|nr:hypothetical protein PENSPDRAFT_748099 [Peniophora sp. CONT]